MIQFPDEILISILTLAIQDEEGRIDLRSISAFARVCKRWDTLCRDVSLWKFAILNLPKPRENSPSEDDIPRFHLSAVVSAPNSADGLFRWPAHAQHSVDVGLDWNRLQNLPARDLFALTDDPYLICRQLQKLSVLMETPGNQSSAMKSVLSASSTDHFQQAATNVLSEYKIFVPDIKFTFSCRDATSFWSSVGNADPNSNEYLVFELKQPWIITQVDIFPYKAYWQYGAPNYSPRKLAVSVGFSPEVHKMHYHSPLEYKTIDNVPKWQSLKLAPSLVIGTHLRIDLLGKYSLQPPPGDQMYYTCLQHVECYGMPIASLYENDLPQLGDFLYKWMLKICPPNKNLSFEQLKQQFNSEHATRQRSKAIEKLARGDDFVTAATLLAKSNPELKIRNERMFRALNTIGNPQRDITDGKLSKVIDAYLAILVEERIPMLSFEAIAYVRQQIAARKMSRILTAINTHVIECDAVIGDLIRPHDPAFALWIFSQANAVGRSVDVLIQLGIFDALIDTIHFFPYPLPYADVMSIILNVDQVETGDEVPPTSFRFPPCPSRKALKKCHVFASVLLMKLGAGLPLSRPVERSEDVARGVLHPDDLMNAVQLGVEDLDELLDVQPIDDSSDDDDSGEEMPVRRQAPPPRRRSLSLNTRVAGELLRQYPAAISPLPEKLEIHEIITRALCVEPQELLVFDALAKDFLLALLKLPAQFAIDLQQAGHSWSETVPDAIRLSIALQRRLKELS